MRLTELALRGWKSFASGEFVRVPFHERLTVLVGANNSGKSNVGEFLEAFVSWSKVVNMDPGRNLKDTFEVHPEKFWNLGVDADFEVGLVLETRELERILRERVPTPTQVLGSIRTTDSAPGSARVATSIRLSSEQPMLDVWESDSDPVLNFDGKVLGRWSELQKQQTFTSQRRLENVPLVAQDVVDVRSAIRESTRGFRRFGAVRSASDERSFASGVVEAMERLSAVDADARQWRDLQRALVGDLRVLVGHRVRGIEFVRGALCLGLSTDGEADWVKIERLGDGVAQFFFILAGMRLDSRMKVLFLDEPEAHLHPGAVVAMLQHILKNFDVQLIVASHSTPVATLGAEYGVVHFWTDERGATQTRPLRSGFEQRALLAELGVEPGHLFLARHVLWVEGPSDVVVLGAALKALDPSLVRGRDYSFAIYGGAAGAGMSLDLDDDEAIVNLLRISMNPIVIHDSDGAADPEDPKAPKPRVVRWKAGAEALGDAGAVFGLGEFRELENLISARSWLDALRAVLPVRDELELPKPDAVDVAGASLPELTAKLALRAGSPLNEEERSKLVERIDRAKMRLARYFVEKGLELKPEAAAHLGPLVERLRG